MIEASAVIRVAFANGPALLAGERELAQALDTLVAETKRRNPGIASIEGSGS